MEFPKTKPWLSEKYLRWIREQPCMMCGDNSNSVVHHLIGVGSMGGMGMKASDSMTCPLCVTCHAKIHSRSSYLCYQWEMITRTLGRAIDQGILKI